MSEAKTGRRLYQCDDCKSRALFHWIEFNRRARPYCPRCGCRRLELVSEEAREDRASKSAVRVAGGTPSTTRPQGRPDRKVT